MSTSVPPITAAGTDPVRIAPLEPPAPQQPASLRREVLAVRAALAVCAVYVLDDNFLHREPGTAVTDHLLSGLVPVALAGALALAYPRLRAGVRAMLALPAGLLAITAGVADGVRHIGVDRLGGDDLTALAALAAGVVLVLAAVSALWRSRRLDRPLARRYGRRALRSAAALVVAFFVVVPIGVTIVATHKARAPVARADLGAPYHAISLRTSDGLTLAGWYVPSRNRAAVIVFPGRSGPVPHARMLVRHGYGVLMLDRRGEGASEGDFNARGWDGEPDLRAALDYLSARADVDPERIGGLGLSVGGELLLQTAAHTETLRAVVSEGAGQRSFAEQLHAPDVPEWRRPLSEMLVETAAMTVLANQPPPPDLAQLMPTIAPRPVLLISAADGNFDEGLNAVYYSRAREPKAVWTVPRGGHTGGLAAVPREYERRMVGFFDTALR